MALDFPENVIFALRELYSRFGYLPYKMSKFEEYDLYARNKDFLVSDRVITFTDLSGRLMALKPDVTLSIVKNSKDLPHTLQKLYYTENVYRAAKGSPSFKEIMQMGLECLGSIDSYSILEVLTLAAQSLRTVSEKAVLDISHQGFLSGLLSGIGVPAAQQGAAMQQIGQKSLHELSALCHSCGVADACITLLQQLMGLKGPMEETLSRCIGLVSGIADTAPLEQLLDVVQAVEDASLKNMLRFDLSVVDDIHYYNGIVFKGFVAGVPNSVLSGGQYDKLMQKLHRKSGAIGFAVYLDQLGELGCRPRQYDVDTVLLYDAGADLKSLGFHVSQLAQTGRSVTAQQSIPENLRYRQLMILKGSEVTLLENNA